MEITGKIGLRSFISAAGFPGYVLLLYNIMLAFFSRQRNMNQVDVIDTSAALQILWTFLAFGAGIYTCFFNQNCRILVFKSPLKWLLFYNLWAIVTLFWSVDPMMTLFRGFEAMAFLLLLTAVIANLYTFLSIKQLIQWLLYFAIFVIGVNVLNRYHEYGMPIFTLENILREQLASTPYFFLALLMPVNWIVKAIILPISIFSFSNTAFAGILTGLVAFVRGQKWMKIMFFVILISGAFALIIFTPTTILKNTVFYGKQGVGLEYTTGRNHIAKVAIKRTLENPLTGFGFVAGEVQLVKSQHLSAIGAHNGILSALLGTGIVGTILLIIFIIKIMKTSNSDYLPDKFRPPFLASVLLITVHTMGNPGLGSRVYGTWIPAVIVFSMICIVELHYKLTKEIPEIF